MDVGCRFVALALVLGVEEVLRGVLGGLVGVLAGFWGLFGALAVFLLWCGCLGVWLVWVWLPEVSSLEKTGVIRNPLKTIHAPAFSTRESM